MKYELKREPEFLLSMIGKCWKILGLYEEESPTLPRYIENTKFEFEGFEQTFSDLNGRIEFLTIISKLNNLHKILKKPIYDKSTHSTVRSQVFSCISLLERLGKDESEV